MESERQILFDHEFTKLFKKLEGEFVCSLSKYSVCFSYFLLFSYVHIHVLFLWLCGLSWRFFWFLCQNCAKVMTNLPSPTER